MAIKLKRETKTKRNIKTELINIHFRTSCYYFPHLFSAIPIFIAHLF